MRTSGGSYLSQSDLRAHFGLAQSTHAESLEVWWPSVRRQVFLDVAADRFYLLVEGRDQLALQDFRRLTGKP